ncbi:carboxylesterase family protein [Lignipirellula cremea]|nr:alpha/beta hydrolase-fold protein [Lignipirellula cremea]
MRAAQLFFLALLFMFPVPTLEGQEATATSAAPAKPAAGEQVEQQFVSKKNPQAKLGYLLYLPDNFDKQEAPVLLFLHGSGERGIDNLAAVKKHGPPRIVENKSLPFLLVSPQCPTDQRWDAAVLSELLDEIVDRYHADKNRIYLTGLSMGGSGTWSLAASEPDKFAAIAPLCGRTELTNAKKVAGLPAWVFCGAKDRQETVQNAKDMAAAITDAGGQAKLTIYPDLPQDCWTVTYDNPEFYTWLLSHQKSP